MVFNLEIIIRNNRVYLKKANLGENFSDLIADLSVDKYGKVKVKTKSNPSFNTNLNHLSPKILTAISKRLEKETSNRALAQIKKKIASVLDIRSIQ